MDYAVTPTQVHFFTSACAAKRRARLPSAGSALLAPDDDFDSPNCADRAPAIAANLAEWGAAVAALRARDPTQWELLARQLQNAVQRFRCPQEIKEDAVAAAVLKVLRLLDRMPSPADLEAGGIEGADQLLAGLPGVYDFATDFYTYARVVARNAARDLLQQTAEQTIGDDFLDLAPAPASYSVDDGEEAYGEACQALAIEVSRLVLLIDDELPRRQREVVRLTLSARPQFWRAVEMTGLPQPPGLDPELCGCDDAQIADRMQTVVNNVRALRSIGKARIEAHDRCLGDLLGRLLDAN
jgi:DNA-directed RNA polymerase specialized sigma24 family protein